MGVNGPTGDEPMCSGVIWRRSLLFVTVSRASRLPLRDFGDSHDNGGQDRGENIRGAFTPSFLCFRVGPLLVPQRDPFDLHAMSYPAIGGSGVKTIDDPVIRSLERGTMDRRSVRRFVFETQSKRRYVVNRWPKTSIAPFIHDNGTYSKRSPCQRHSAYLQAPYCS